MPPAPSLLRREAPASAIEQQAADLLADTSGPGLESRLTLLLQLEPSLAKYWPPGWPRELHGFQPPPAPSKVRLSCRAYQDLLERAPALQEHYAYLQAPLSACCARARAAYDVRVQVLARDALRLAAHRDLAWAWFLWKSQFSAEQSSGLSPERRFATTLKLASWCEATRFARSALKARALEPPYRVATHLLAATTKRWSIWTYAAKDHPLAADVERDRAYWRFTPTDNPKMADSGLSLWTLDADMD